MKLKTAKHILYVSCVIMAILFIIASLTRNGVYMTLGAVAAFSGAAFWIVFGKCPSCGKFLGRADHKYCPHCSKKVE